VTPTRTRHVNAYEGPHRLTVAGDPLQWGVAGSVQIGDDPEDPPVPTG
jgi:hypothetical protein